MTFIQRVIAEVHDNCEALRDMALIFESWEDAGRAIDKSALPAMVAILPPSGTMLYRNGRVYDRANIAVAFLDKVQRDANGEDDDNVAGSMREKAGQFLAHLNRSGMVEPIEQTTYTNIYERKSSIVAGCYLDLTVTNREGLCYA